MRKSNRISFRKEDSKADMGFRESFLDIKGRDTGSDWRSGIWNCIVFVGVGGLAL
jgi:hypothetical protein